MRGVLLLVIIGIVAATLVWAVQTAPLLPTPVAVPGMPPSAPELPGPEIGAPTVEYEPLSPEWLNRLGLLGDIRFEFDSSDIREGDRFLLAANADVLRKYDLFSVTVEGHCDERGTLEYNRSLGDRRAKAASDYLESLGIPVSRFKTVSYGREAPLCKESNEACWGRNRNVHFTVTESSGRR